MAKQGVVRMAKARVRVEFISSGFHDLLESSGVSELVDDTAESVAAKASAMASVDSEETDGEPPRYVVKGPKAGNYGGGRVIAYVAADNSAAVIDESRHATLEKALG